MKWERLDQMQDGNSLLESFCHGPAKNPTSYYLYLLWRVRRLVSQHHSVIISYCLRVSSFKDRQDWWWQFRYHLGFPLSHGESWELCHSRWYDSWPDKKLETIRNGLQLSTALEGARWPEDTMIPWWFCLLLFVCVFDDLERFERWQLQQCLIMFAWIRYRRSF